MRFTDPSGELWWLAPAIGAILGGTARGIIANNNGQDWWKGAIVGGLVGATEGLYASAAIGASGITVGNAGIVATKSWGIMSTAFQSAKFEYGNKCDKWTRS